MNKLPSGWTYAKLGEVANYINGKAFKPSDWKQKGYPIIRIQNLNDPNAKFNYADSTHESKYIVNRGELLVSWSASLGVYIWNYSTAWLNQHIFKVDFNEKILTRDFFFYAIKQTIRDLHEKTHGTGMVHVTKKDFENHKIPLPPLREQHRIVAKLDKLLAKVDQCQARLEKIPGILKRLRTAIIAGACAGTLTSDWREVNPSAQGAAHVLEDNNKKRTQKYQKACREAEQAGKPKPREYRTNHEPIDDSEYQWLPETWKLERLCNIAQICGGVTKGRKLKNRTTIRLPYLRVANVQDGYLDLSEIKHIEALPEDLDKYGLKKGDVLFTEGGDRDKLGRGTVWNDEIEDCIHQNHVFRARLYSFSILPEYVSLATKSEQSRNFFFKNANQTVNLASINMTSLGNLPIPIPPYEEQRAIIKRVKRLYEIAGQLEKRYSKGRIHIDNLTQSILAKAFRGELVPQDPNDDPAAELLERIKKEKERQSFKNNSKRNSKNQNQKKKARA